MQSAIETAHTTFGASVNDASAAPAIDVCLARIDHRSAVYLIQPAGFGRQQRSQQRAIRHYVGALIAASKPNVHSAPLVRQAAPYGPRDTPPARVVIKA